jgi:hypothetical protein
VTPAAARRPHASIYYMFSLYLCLFRFQRTAAFLASPEAVGEALRSGLGLAAHCIVSPVARQPLPNLEALRSPMTSALRRMGTELAYLMVARNEKGKTRVEKQGSGNSATVKITVKIPKEVSYHW